jgi:quercetin dioxygenase-like cupin family protein
VGCRDHFAVAPPASAERTAKVGEAPSDSNAVHATKQPYIWIRRENVMMAKPHRAYALIPIVILTIFSARHAIADATPVRETTGVEISHVESLDLTPWAGDVKGRQLRIRKLTIQPGGVIAIHTHDDRPDASYLVQGELTEYRAGGYVKRRAKDTVHTAGKDVTHWVANEGNIPAVLVVVDVYRP